MTDLSPDTIEKLILKAHEMQEMSYAPYSGFNVGAALLTVDNEIYGGCNIENAAFSPTICAERTAIFKAVSEGKRDFRAIAIVGGKKKEIGDLCFPCGVCRQVMAEFCDPDSFRIITRNREGETVIHTLRELLPESFGL
ncbi:MAG: cytidine deaminase [Lachnospiraceae bacterium]|nr:cytidine deaminase [Lachnospiraceae bacterium]